MFTEEYQRDFLVMYSKVFNEFSNVCGDLLNFMTSQGLIRVQSNKKGGVYKRS